MNLTKRLCAAFFVSAVGVVLASCSASKEDVGNNNVDSPDVPEVVDSDSVTVSLKAIGDFTASPLSKAGGSSDLYALQVCQQVAAASSGNANLVDGYVHSWYAMGVFDDLSHAVIKLSKKYKYSFTLAYIPDGKNVLQKTGTSSYGSPCMVLPDGSDELQVNELRYDTDTYLWLLRNGASQMKGIESYLIQYNGWNTVCRYQGYVRDFDPNVSSEVSIDLYRQSIGFKLIVDDFTKGEIILHGMYGHSYSLKPSSSSYTNVLEVEVELVNMPCAYTRGAWLAEEDVYIVYKDDYADEIPLLTLNGFSVERNTLYTLRFSLSDAIANGGITANIVEDGGMKEVQMEI